MVLLHGTYPSCYQADTTRFGTFFRFAAVYFGTFFQFEITTWGTFFSTRPMPPPSPLSPQHRITPKPTLGHHQRGARGEGGIEHKTDKSYMTYVSYAPQHGLINRERLRKTKRKNGVQRDSLNATRSVLIKCAAALGPQAVLKQCAAALAHERLRTCQCFELSGVRLSGRQQVPCGPFRTGH